jgi:Family of unknown function (DUF5684)
MNGILWFYLALVVFWVLGTWCVFAKAGESGWQAIIPIWNTIVLLRIVGRPWWWLILYVIPIVGLITLIVVASDLSKSFGRGGGTTVGLILLQPIFVMILGFGSAEYHGPSAGRGQLKPAY